ncbi:MAG TPA: type II toxin-antitoxin system Phd/YefM family antitoxin, partial [Acidimicrobiia bacterium]|nr:type II toxin-antitoxin system Phd/YefM family antitoxin [Acidimicrobiia bacterium]
SARHRRPPVRRRVGISMRSGALRGGCCLGAALTSGVAACHLRGTIVTMTTDSLRNVKDRFSEFVDRVEREHERVVVTRNGRPAAVMISPDDLESLEETLALLGDSDAVKALTEAETAVAAGDVVRGVDAVRALRSRPPR